MGKLIGTLLIIWGIAGYLYSWQFKQKARRERVESFIVFLQKSVFIMEAENIKVGHLFCRCQGKSEVLNKTLSEVARRLELNIYPKGESVWEEVFREEEQNWDLDQETFGLIINAGNGFFGKNRSENVCFLQKSIRDIELQEKKNKEKDAKERKVWIPVGMLSGMMIVILFI